MRMGRQRRRTLVRRDRKLSESALITYLSELLTMDSGHYPCITLLKAKNSDPRYITAAYHHHRKLDNRAGDKGLSIPRHDGLDNRPSMDEFQAHMSCRARLEEGTAPCQVPTH